MSQHRRDTSNLEALNRFWRRTPFHDMVIEEVRALNKRVVIRLEVFTLVVTEVTGLKPCELPTVWLHNSIVSIPGGSLLDVETESGHLSVKGVDFRLIQNDDLAILIPPIDAR
jgi:hypothetical protein